MPMQNCLRCGAGSTISFNWDYAVESARTAKPFRDLSVFAPAQTLRQGGLFRCTFCGQSWYLVEGRQKMMHAVVPERAALIQRWGERPILLSPELKARLASIGRTPPDLYGNGSEYHETPCSVKTANGELSETSDPANMLQPA